MVFWLNTYMLKTNSYDQFIPNTAASSDQPNNISHFEIAILNDGDKMMKNGSATFVTLNIAINFISLLVFLHKCQTEKIVAIFGIFVWKSNHFFHPMSWRIWNGKSAFKKPQQNTSLQQKRWKES